MSARGARQSLGDRWVAWCAREEDPLPLAAVRVGVCAVLLGDVAATFLHGVRWAPWVDAAAGGLAAAPHPLVAAGLGALVGPDLAGPVALLLLVGGLVPALLGVATRPALLLAVAASLHLALLDDAADRGVDRLLRIALVLCALGASDRRLSVRRGPAAPGPIPAWPRDLLRTTLVGLYAGAGLTKLVEAPAWVLGGDPPVLARVLADPTLSRLPPDLALAHPRLAYAVGLGVVAWELTAPLLWTRHARAWAAAGIAFHLGTAALLDLGAFPWGVLALYPALLVATPDRREA